jgi:hypothetical protein
MRKYTKGNTRAVRHGGIPTGRDKLRDEGADGKQRVGAKRGVQKATPQNLSLRVRMGNLVGWSFVSGHWPWGSGGVICLLTQVFCVSG